MAVLLLNSVYAILKYKKNIQILKVSTVTLLLPLKAKINLIALYKVVVQRHQPRPLLSLL